MNPRRAVMVALGLILVGMVLWRRSVEPERTPGPPQEVPVTAPTPEAGSPAAPTETPPGDLLLRDYATAKTTPEQDLDLVARSMDSFLLLVKPGARGPLADNEDWAAAWQGHRASREAFIGADHRILKDSRLVDRWSTPLFFHALGAGRFAVRSAGPDRRLWTEDDLQRNPDGTYRRGADLNPAGRAGN